MKGKIPFIFVAFKRINNRVINLFNLQSLSISTQKNFLENFKFLETPTTKLVAVSIICHYVKLLLGKH